MIGGRLEWVAAHATVLLAGGVLIGLVLPPLADLLRPLLVPIIIVNLAISQLRLDIDDIRLHLRRPLLIIAIVAFGMIAAPLAMAWVAPALGLPGPLAAALVLMGAAPPIMSAPALCLIFGLDAALCLIVVLLGYAIVPFTLPPLALWLVGIEVDVTVIELTVRLAMIVGISFAIAFALRRWVLSPAVLARASRSIDGLLVVSMVVFAIGVMAGVTEFAIDRPAYVAVTILAAFAANALFQVLGALAFAATGRRAALTIGLVTGNCNIALVMATLSDRADMDLLVFFALGQLPIYMLPLAALPIYRRLLR